MELKKKDSELKKTNGFMRIHFAICREKKLELTLQEKPLISFFTNKMKKETPSKCRQLFGMRQFTHKNKMLI